MFLNENASQMGGPGEPKIETFRGISWTFSWDPSGEVKRAKMKQKMSSEWGQNEDKMGPKNAQIEQKWSQAGAKMLSNIGLKIY